MERQRKIGRKCEHTTKQTRQPRTQKVLSDDDDNDTDDDDDRWGFDFVRWWYDYNSGRCSELL